jgi:N-methylhydantoinase A
MRLRIAIDIGGTFSDAAVEGDDGTIAIFKAATVADAPIEGVLAALDHAAFELGLTRRALLAATDTFVYTSTKAINAIVTGRAATTALVTTAGHPDILLLREGGRSEPFNYTLPFPAPLVPRRLTYPLEERVDARGRIVVPLSADGLEAIAVAIERDRVEAVAVCLLWSILNPAHEIAVGEYLNERLPGLPVTLSHRLNPCLREYRRASSACLDASLKPVMADHLAAFEARLRDEGFAGTALAVTSQGGVMPLGAMADAPIHALNSGPSMAPVCGRAVAKQDADSVDAIVIDAGGTTFDVSLVAKGQLPLTQELWIGGRYRGHLTGFPSVDVRSVGAGGGSIAWVDDGGLLHVGPRSAGATPGPACYRRGGEQPTVTDAALVLGYIDPDHFLGGRMTLDRAASEVALQPIADALGLPLAPAALAVLEVAGEAMVQAIEEVTIERGVDPARAVLVAGGGAAGLRAIELGRRVGCRAVLFPSVGPAASAVGALCSDLLREWRMPRFVRLSALAACDVARIRERLAERMTRDTGPRTADTRLEYFFEGRYERQIWEIEVTFGADSVDADAPTVLRRAFDDLHRQLYGIADAGSDVEIVSWGVRRRVPQRDDRELPRLAARSAAHDAGAARRPATFADMGTVEVDVVPAGRLIGSRIGPLIVESALTTIVVPPGARIEPSGLGLIATPEPHRARPPEAGMERAA